MAVTGDPPWVDQPHRKTPWRREVPQPTPPLRARPVALYLLSRVLQLSGRLSESQPAAAAAPGHYEGRA